MPPKECEHHNDFTERIVKLETEVGHMKNSMEKVEKAVEWLASKVIFANGVIATVLYLLSKGVGQ